MARSARRPKRRAIVRDIEIGGKLDAHAVEAFGLELRRLVKRYGGEIKEFGIGRWPTTRQPKPR